MFRDKKSSGNGISAKEKLMNIKKIVLLIIIFLLSVTICVVGIGAFYFHRNWPISALSSSIDRADLVGKYSITWIPAGGKILGRETLILNDNGTFNQIFKSSKGAIRRNSGKWKWDSSSKMLVLDDIKLYVDESDKVNLNAKSTSVSTDAIKQFDQIWLIVNEDLGYYYKKNK